MNKIHKQNLYFGQLPRKYINWGYQSRGTLGVLQASGGVKPHGRLKKRVFKANLSLCELSYFCLIILHFLSLFILNMFLYVLYMFFLSISYFLIHFIGIIFHVKISFFILFRLQEDRSLSPDVAWLSYLRGCYLQKQRGNRRAPKGLHRD